MCRKNSFWISFVVLNVIRVKWPWLNDGTVTKSQTHSEYNFFLRAYDETLTWRRDDNKESNSSWIRPWFWILDNQERPGTIQRFVFGPETHFRPIPKSKRIHNTGDVVIPWPVRGVTPQGLLVSQLIGDARCSVSDVDHWTRKGLNGV